MRNSPKSRSLNYVKRRESDNFIAYITVTERYCDTTNVNADFNMFVTQDTISFKGALTLAKKREEINEYTPCIIMLIF